MRRPTLTGFSLLLLFLSLLLLVVVVRSQSDLAFDDAVNAYVFVPQATQTSTIAVNGGQASVPLTTALLKSSNVLNKGAFYVGDYKVDVVNTPPTWNYLYKEVARLPKAVEPMVINVCSVLDVAAFEAVAAATSPQQLSAAAMAAIVLQQQSNAANPVPAASPVARRLLQNMQGGVDYSLSNSASIDMGAGAYNPNPVFPAPPSGFSALQQAQYNSFDWAKNYGGDLGNFQAVDQAASYYHIPVDQAMAVLLAGQQVSGLDYTSVGDESTGDAVWVQADFTQRMTLLFQAGLLAINRTNTIKDLQTQVEAATAAANRAALLANAVNATISSVNNALASIQAISAQTDLRLSLLANNTAANLKGTAEALQSEIQGSSYLIGNLSLSIVNVITALAEEAVYRESADSEIEEAIATINSALYYELTQTMLKRAASTQYFNLVKQLPSSFFPLVLDPGSPPVNGGVLIGEDTFVNLETFTLTYALNSSTIGTAVITWNFLTDYLLAHMNPALTARNLINSLSVANCSRSFYDTSRTWYNVNGALDKIDARYNASSAGRCQAWIEIRDYPCTIANSAGKSPAQWVASAGNLEIDTSYCVVGATKPTFTVIRAFSDFSTYFSGRFCDSSVPGRAASPTAAYYTLKSLNSDFLGAVTQASGNVIDPATGLRTCYSGIMSQLAAAPYTALVPPSLPVVGTTVAGTLFSVAFSAYPVVFNTVLEREQKKYGRLSGGLDYVNMPFMYVPPIGNSTTNGAYSPRNCVSVRFNVVHKDTVPVYSVIPDTTQLVSKGVTRMVTQVAASKNGAPLLSDAGIAIGSPQTFTDVTLSDDASHLLPKNSLVVGDFKDPFYLYDVPDALLDVTNSTYARMFKASAYMMPPGTEQTMSLPDFNALNYGLYDAPGMGVGVNLFAIPATTDAQGYRICDVGSGLADASTLNGLRVSSARTCQGNGAYAWQNAVLSPASMDTVCAGLFAPGQTPILLYARSAAASSDSEPIPFYNATSDWFNPSQRGFAVHFLFEGVLAPNMQPLVISSCLAGNAPQLLSIQLSQDNGLVVTYADRTYSASFPFFFNGQKHAVLVLFTGDSQIDTLVFEVDGWLDSVYNNIPVMMTAPPPGPPDCAVWQPDTTNALGLEAVYAIPWEFGYLNASYVELVRVCSFAVAESHCQPVANALPIVLGSPVGSLSPVMPCLSDGMIAFRSMLLDASVLNNTGTTWLDVRAAQSISTSTTSLYPFMYSLGPIKAGPFGFRASGSVGFAITFWLHVSQAWASLSPPSVSGDGSITLFTLQSMTGDVSVSFSIASGGSLRASVNSLGVISGLYVLSTKMTAVKVGLVYYPSSSALALFVNGQQDTTRVVPAGFAGTSATNYQFRVVANSDLAPPFSMLRVYSRALSQSDLSTEITCDTSALATYDPPTGYCRAYAATDGSYANNFYCRSPALCNGNCETYATYSASTQTFTPIGAAPVFSGGNQCDDGWLPPDCVKPCAGVDANGVCPNPNEVADGAYASIGSSQSTVAGGSWCDVLREYKVTASTTASASRNGYSTLTMEPRAYSYSFDLPIPTVAGALITSALNISGRCPLVATVGSGFGAQLKLTNPSATDAQIIVEWIVSQDCPFSPPCSIDIPAYFTSFCAIPQCLNASAVVSVLAFSAVNASLSQIACSVVSEAALFSSLNATYSTATIETTVQITDSALAASLSVSNGLYALILSLAGGLGVSSDLLNKIYADAASNNEAAAANSKTISNNADLLSRYGNITLLPPTCNEACQAAIKAAQDNIAAAKQALDKATVAPGGNGPGSGGSSSSSSSGGSGTMSSSDIFGDIHTFGLLLAVSIIGSLITTFALSCCACCTASGQIKNVFQGYNPVN